jgi:hypothetical protein
MEKFLENNWFKVKLVTAVTTIITLLWFAWLTGGSPTIGTTFHFMFDN